MGFQNMLPSTLTSVAQVIVDVLDERGIDGHRIVREVGLDPRRMQDPNARYPFSAMTRLWLSATEISADPCFGLEVGNRFHPTSLHAIGFAWLASDSLLDAMQRLARFFRVATTASAAEVTLGNDGYVLRLRPADNAGVTAPAAPAAQDATAAAIVQMCRLSIGRRFRPSRIELPHDRPSPACVKKLVEQLRAPVIFDTSDFGLVIDRHLAEKRLPSGNAELAHANEKVLIDYLAHLDRNAIGERVKARLVDALPAGAVSEADMANSLNMSVRSLQRRLSEDQTSYKGVLDDTRRDLALTYLGNSRLSINEVTYLLGFSDPSNFTRAFKRWSGQTPSQYRAERLGESAVDTRS
jgi:AraC-like DNA-binding protein